MRKFFVFYNEISQKLEDWVFKHIVPPTLKLIEVVLRFTMIYAFYLLIKNSINEIL
jgi:hypothetical protein